ncbi:MAG: hypothetical protein JXA07_05485 [Spirochaetes bacterium]|nr:hypothetical protein [Spirochaetota bacterium]
MSKALKSVETDLTTLEIYPHTGSAFHYFMGLVCVLVILPMSCVLFPFLLMIKAFLVLMLYLPLLKIAGESGAVTIDALKNRLASPFHYLVYKLFYVYMAIWLASFYRFDDHWYGIDISGYKDFNDYMSNYRDSRVRWRFKKKLKTYAGQGITESVVPDHLVFFRVILSRGIFSLVRAAAFRKNSPFTAVSSIVMILRDYYLLLFLPIRLHVYSKDGAVVALATYLKRGNTMIMCQHIIADGYIRSGLFYKHMRDCIDYAFAHRDVRYVSCSVTTEQAKRTSGCYPINFLQTDEFSFRSFSRMKMI